MSKQTAFMKLRLQLTDYLMVGILSDHASSGKASNFFGIAFAIV